MYKEWNWKSSIQPAQDSQKLWAYLFFPFVRPKLSMSVCSWHINDVNTQCHIIEERYPFYSLLNLLFADSQVSHCAWKNKKALWPTRPEWFDWFAEQNDIKLSLRPTNNRIISNKALDLQQQNNIIESPDVFERYSLHAYHLPLFFL